MKKRVKGRKLHRKRDQRRALLRSLVRALIMEERIKTTVARAKEARTLAERLIHKAKKGDLSAIRYVRAFLDEKATFKLIKEIAPRYKNREGGYTRVIRAGVRRSDSAQLAYLELVEPLTSNTEKDAKASN